MPGSKKDIPKGFQSLAFTVAVAFLALSFTVLLSSTAFELFFNFQIQQQVISNEQRVIAQGAVSKVTNFIEGHFRALDQVAVVNTIITASSADQKRVMEKLLGQNPAFRQLFLLSADGRVVQHVSRLPSGGADPLTADIQKELLARTTRDGGETYISSIYIDPATNEPLVLIANPARSVYKDPEGALVAEMNLKFMWDLVGTIRVGEHGRVYVVDEKGNLIAYRDIGRVLALENLSPLFEVEEFLESERGDEFRPDISRGIEGDRVVSTYADLGTPHWAVIVEVPLLEAYGPVLQVLWYSLLIIACAALVAAGSGVYLSRRITRGVIDLDHVASEISRGNFAARIKITSRNEIGRLADSFNAMAGKLQEIYGNLDAKVKEKTEELSTKVEEAQNAKSAVLNLLEDVRASEEKEKKQSEEVKKAMEQVSSFASDADQQRNLYMLLLASIGEGVFVLDLEQKVTLVNKSAEAIFGYTSDELVGKRLHDLIKFVHADKKPLEESVWSDTFKSRSTSIFPSDISVVSKDGTTVPIVVVSAPIVDKGTNEMSGLIVTFRDVREERALEEARIGFISIASHQLRTPLTSMRWFSEMLIGGDAGAISEDQKHYVERIYQGTDRMIALVNLLLQIARVEAGRMKIEPVPIDFKNLIRGMTVSLKSLLDAKSQKIDMITDPDPFPVINMDQEVIWQVIQNLISNASRYAPKDGTITAKIVQKADFAEFSVSDKGIGIPKDQQGRIFEKFFRAENALKLVPEGSGLGLSLVKSLVERWGGKIWFESEEGRGTTFFFTVPFTGMAAKEGDVKLAV